MEYTDQNRAKLKEYDNVSELVNFLKKQNLLEKFAAYAEKRGLKRRNNLMYRSRQLFEDSLYGNVIYNMLGLETYISYMNQTDKTVQKALQVLEEGESFPKAPAHKKNK